MKRLRLKFAASALMTMALFACSDLGNKDFEPETTAQNTSSGTSETSSSSSLAEAAVSSAEVPLVSSSLEELYSSSSDPHGTLTDTRDGIIKSYKTIRIGSQNWMAENLNYATSSGSYCDVNTTDYCVIYGRLYNWESANIVCPSGWHLPKDTEWTILFNAVGGESSAGAKLRGVDGWNVYPGVTNVDEYGFSAMGGGSWGGAFGGTDAVYVRDTGFWWTSTEAGTTSAWRMAISSAAPLIQIDQSDKTRGLSVRCVQNP